MPACLVLGLILATSQTNPTPPKPTIIQMNLGLAGSLFTGVATGWPFREGRWNWMTATVNNPLDRELDAELTFCTLTPQATGRFHVTRSFHLPPQCAMRVSFPVRSSPPNPPTTLPIHAALDLKINGEVVDQKRPFITFVED